MTPGKTEDTDVQTPQTAAPDPSGPTPGSGSLLLWIVAAALCLCLCWLIYSGIHSRVQAEAALEHAARASETPSVTVIHPKPGSSNAEIVLPGNTQPYIDTPIYARTSGYLKAWYADIGAHVGKGQLLAVIESPEVDQQLQQAQADLKNAEANLKLEQITAARYQNLLKTNAVSIQDTDNAVSALAAGQATVASNQANVRRLQQLQSFERIVAPFDGVITARNTDIGDLIQAGDPATSKELFHLASISRLRVYIAVPEVDANAVHTGEKVPLTVDTLPGQTFTGTLVRDSDSIDPASRTLNVEVNVENPSGRLMPGAYASVHLPIQPTAGAVTIPANTLLFRSQGMQAGVVRNGRVTLVPITIGHDYGSSVEVVAGLTPNDAVIVNPSDSLESGAAVLVQKQNAPPPDEAP